MNKEEIIEGNELIVSFLGWTKFSHNQRYNLTGCRDYDCYNIGEFSKYSDIYIPECGDLPAAHYNLEFHSSWSWLMPVVEKIESIGETDKSYGVLCDITTTYIRIGPISIDLKIKKNLSKIEAVYNAIVEFIKWYNTQNNE